MNVIRAELAGADTCTAAGITAPARAPRAAECGDENRAVGGKSSFAPPAQIIAKLTN
jgi:hypothetical protein